jgi:hypothetical protein
MLLMIYEPSAVERKFALILTEMLHIRRGKKKKDKTKKGERFLVK